MLNKIWDFAEKAIKKPTTCKELEVYEVLDMKVNLIILVGIKDSLIPHFSMEKTAHEMWEYLWNLF